MHLQPFPFKPLLAAALLACASLSAQAALVNFSGVTDSGPLLGTAFSGSFSYTDPLPGNDSAVLESFALDFNGQTYTLANADPALTPLAWFSSGSFVGVDYASDPLTLPMVNLTAGFFDIGEAFFSYDTTGNGIEGAGSITFAAAVPEPFSLALALTSLALLSATRRRRG